MSIKNIVADTNLWYDTVTDETNILKLKRMGKICATAMNILELNSKIDESSFELRKNAAKMIVKHADRYIASPEDYLYRYWSVELKEQFDWKQGVLTLARARDFNELKKGYIDPVDGSKRKLNTELLKDWREYQYSDFQKEVINAITTIIPNYRSRIESSSKIPKITDQSVLSEFRSSEFIDSLVSVTYQRVLLGHKLDGKIVRSKKPTKSEIQQAYLKLNRYAKAYGEYLRLLCERGAKPDKNDLGDHENFMYLQNNNWLLATADKRWVDIASLACQRNIIDTKNI